MSAPVLNADSTTGLPRRAWVRQVMGLPVSICVRTGDRTVPGCDLDSADVARRVETAYATLGVLDQQFSTYRADSEVSLLRAGRVSRPSPELRQVISLCEKARVATGGAFDADLPGGFDPSGLVKGWAVERAATALRGLGSHHDWLVNAGGDVLVHAREGRSWTVGVQDPLDTSHISRALAVTSGAVATSGTAARGAHITDPATGLPAAPVLVAATVVGASLVWADVYATAAIVKAEGAQAWLDGLEGYRGFVVRSARPVAAPA